MSLTLPTLRCTSHGHCPASISHPFITLFTLSSFFRFCSSSASEYTTKLTKFQLCILESDKVALWATNEYILRNIFPPKTQKINVPRDFAAIWIQERTVRQKSCTSTCWSNWVFILLRYTDRKTTACSSTSDKFNLKKLAARIIQIC